MKICDQVSFVVENETGTRVSKYYTRHGDAVNFSLKLNNPYPKNKYTAVLVHISKDYPLNEGEE